MTKLCLFAPLAIVLLSGCATGVSIGPLPQASQGPPGPEGPAGLTFRNAYNPATAYVATDAVAFQGSTYIALASNTNVPPAGNQFSATDWALLAQAGAQGPAGAQGTAGLQGPQGGFGPIGPQGIPGNTGATGPQGPSGPAGVQGATGTQGPVGVQGLPGPIGPNGIAGTSGPSGPQGAIGPPGLTGPAGTTSYNPAMSPWFGKRYGVLGDSYSQFSMWQTTVSAFTGMTLSFLDAHAGRSIGSIFDCYGGSGATLVNQGTCGVTNNGVKGQTFAQDIAGLDLLIVQLGVNDVNGEALGSASSSSSDASTYGYIMRSIETIQAANPTVRIVWIDPVQTGDALRIPQLPGIAQAILGTAAGYGVPVIDLFHESGINKLNVSNFMQPDLLHLKDPILIRLYGGQVALKLNTILPIN